MLSQAWLFGRHGKVSAKDRSITLRLLILVVVVIAASLAAWFYYKAGRGDPRTRQYTTRQWLQMVKQAQHQPVAIWEGAFLGEIRRDYGGGELRFKETPAGVLEAQVDTLLQQEALMFLPLFDSKDPQIVLAGVYVYHWGKNLPDKLTEAEKAKIAAAFRKLFDHEDVRIRWAAVVLLAWRHWLTVEDVRRGLNDRTLAVRWITAANMAQLTFSSRTELLPQYSSDGRLLKADPLFIGQFVQTKRELAPILIEHLNDAHHQLRFEANTTLRSLFIRRVAGHIGTHDEPYPILPPKIDYLKGDWEIREENKKAWKAWWREHGEEALRWAHPPQ